MKIFVTVCSNTLWGVLWFQRALTGRWPTSASASGRCIRSERRPIITLALWGSAKLAAISPRSWPRWGIGFPAGRAVKSSLPASLLSRRGAGWRIPWPLDALINVLPLTGQTRGILAHPFQQLPDGASLINCGRGEHMVNQDVLAALDSGKLAGAVLDVFPVEPLPADDPLWRHPQVVITRIWPLAPAGGDCPPAAGEHSAPAPRRCR
jgi:glyoxylate/hydroxypyruvate reductase A